jgi:hypothetical protein
LSLDDKEILSIGKFYYSDPSEVSINEIRYSLQQSGIFFAGQYLQKIRAKIALIELAAILNPAKIVHVLLILSPSYFGSLFVQDWIRKNQFGARVGTSRDNKNSIRNLRNISKAINLDNRKPTARKYDYWYLERIYTQLVTDIKYARKDWHHKDKKMRDHAQVHFNITCDASSLSEDVREGIANDTTTPANYAIEIMIDRGLIQAESNFRDIQSQVTRLKKKHNFYNYHVNIRKFLSYPSKNPDEFLKRDYFKVLNILE